MEENDRRQWLTGTVHMLVLVLVYALPVIYELSEGGGWHRSHRMWFFQSFSVAVFYINYFLLVPRFLLRRSIWRYLAGNAAVFILMGVLLDQFSVFFFTAAPAGGGQGSPGHGNAPFGRPPQPDGPRIMYMLRPVISFIIAAGLGVAVGMTENWFRSEAHRKELEKSRLESELSHLKLQLNPHFFFNTLNSIYALIERNPSQARAAIHELSRLMRYLLHESECPEVPLEREVVFLRNYISLMRIRLPGTVAVTVELPAETHGTVIAPLLFVSLVDNAFKYGVGALGASFITIRLQAEPARVILTVDNSLSRPAANRLHRTGIGLANLRKRLELIYPGRHALVAAPDASAFHAMLEVRL